VSSGGAQWVDATALCEADDVTTLDWYGCATFRLKTAGMTIFLDAYIDRAPSAEGPGMTADQIDDCDWIVIGHSHFDHLYGAERIMANTGATLIGSYETVRVMEQAGVPTDRMMCVAGGEFIDLGNGASVGVYPSQHSCVWSHTQMAQPSEVCLGDLGVTFQEQEARLAELTTYLATELDPVAVEHLIASAPGHSDRGDGGALVFLFQLPDGTVLFQDTSGHWSGVLADLKADVAIFAAAGRANIDGEPIQGTLAEFIGQQALAVQPSTVVLGHHDDWLPGFSIPTDTTPIRDEIASVASGTTLLEPGYLAASEILTS
jgi:L-ascorbate metabolism protein UlaG (beta-lactamase superfamily)